MRFQVSYSKFPSALRDRDDLVRCYHYELERLDMVFFDYLAGPL